MVWRWLLIPVEVRRLTGSDLLRVLFPRPPPPHRPLPYEKIVSSPTAPPMSPPSLIFFSPRRKVSPHCSSLTHPHAPHSPRPPSFRVHSCVVVRSGRVAEAVGPMGYWRSWWKATAPTPAMGVAPPLRPLPHVASSVPLTQGRRVVGRGHRRGWGGVLVARLPPAHVPPRPFSRLRFQVGEGEV